MGHSDRIEPSACGDRPQVADDGAGTTGRPGWATRDWTLYRGYVILGLILGIAFGGYVLYDRWPRPEAIEIVVLTPTATCTPAPLKVHVVGAVRRPGVYTLPSDSRLIKAVEAAGGLSADADQERVNLADHLFDGQQVHIPRVNTPLPPSPTPLAAGQHVPGGSGSGEDRGLVDLNTATAAELDTLPRIGPTYAQRIIAYRQEHGPFTDPAQLMEIKGIGQATYDGLRDLITVD